MRRRGRTAQVLPSSFVLPSIGPPKTNKQYARERQLPLSRVRPPAPRTVEILKLSEAVLANEGLQWLIRFHIRPDPPASSNVPTPNVQTQNTANVSSSNVQFSNVPSAENPPSHISSDAAPDGISPQIRRALREFAVKRRESTIDLLQFKVADENKSILPDVNSNADPFCLGDRLIPSTTSQSSQLPLPLSSSPFSSFSPPALSPPSRHMSPPDTLNRRNSSGGSYLTPFCTTSHSQSKVSQSDEVPQLQSQITKSPTQCNEEFRETEKFGKFETYFPYVPLRLFLDDWDERPNGTLRVGKLKQTIFELMSGSTKLDSLSKSALNDLSMALIHLNFAQLVTFRAAQPTGSYGIDELCNVVSRLDDYISETLIHHIFTNTVTPVVAAQKLTKAYPDPTPTSCKGDGVTAFMESRVPYSSFFEITSMGPDCGTKVIRYESQMKQHRDRYRKTLLGSLPTVFKLKQRDQGYNPKTARIIRRINETRRTLQNGKSSGIDEMIREIGSRQSKPMVTSRTVVRINSGCSTSWCDESELPGRSQKGWTCKERRLMGRQLLLTVGAINMLTTPGARALKYTATWWFISPGADSQLPPPPRLPGQYLLNSPPPRGIFVHYPSLIARADRPSDQIIYTVHIVNPPSYSRSASRPSDLSQWSILSMGEDGDIRLLEPIKWNSVMNELSANLSKRFEKRTGSEQSIQISSKQEQLTNQQLSSRTTRGGILERSSL